VPTSPEADDSVEVVAHPEKEKAQINAKYDNFIRYLNLSYEKINNY
jgi:hypothetical protein